MKLRPIVRAVFPVKTELRLKRALYRLMPAKHRSQATNVYHCCVRKTASQWIRVIMSDPLVYQYSGLVPYDYKAEQGGDNRKITERSFAEPFPERTIVTPLYIDHENYAALPKPASYRTIYIQRDPRDILVSSYFAARYSHPDPSAGLKAQRERLSQLKLEEGLKERIDDIEPQFVAMRTWAGAAQSDPNVAMFRYEDLVGPEAASHFEQLFLHCDIPLGRDNILKLLDRYSFKRMSEGREQGQEDKLSKYRKGKAGDWVEYFTPAVSDYFDKVTGDLVPLLGYAAAPPHQSGAATR